MTEKIDSWMHDGYYCQVYIKGEEPIVYINGDKYYIYNMRPDNLSKNKAALKRVKDKVNMDIEEGNISPGVEETQKVKFVIE